MTDLKRICNEIEIAVMETEKFIIRESGKFDIAFTETKGLHDFVTYVDKGSEKMLVERLKVIMPDAGFIAEEGTAAKKGVKYCWVIDPLDGTTNFVHGIRPYAISVALTGNGEPVAGVVCNVGVNELFKSWKNGGAWLNEKSINVSSASSLEDSLVATGFPYNDFSRLEEYMDSLTYFCRSTHGIRRLGSASIDLAYVACGRFEAFYEYGLKIWDVAAGILMVREAGGRVSDFSGNETKLDGNEIVAACNKVFPEFLENVSKFMQK
ncbi:MAG: inositol monophosphatase [Bacteroidales bacterium]|jgi:myo-inositol-1(or 4)-monophosphatase|nr:inositol monophosphatase [Bacteroidales bacterium]